MPIENETGGLDELESQILQDIMANPELAAEQPAPAEEPISEENILRQIQKQQRRTELEEKARALSEPPEFRPSEYPVAALGATIGRSTGSLLQTAGGTIEYPPFIPQTEVPLRGPFDIGLLGRYLPKQRKRVVGQTIPAKIWRRTVGRLGEPLQEYGAKQKAEYAQAEQELGGTVPGKIFNQIVGTFIESLPPMVVGVATGSMPAVVLSAGLQSYGSQLESGIEDLQKRDPNLSRDQAAQIVQPGALLAGASTAALTQLVGVKGEKGLETLTIRLNQMLRGGQIDENTIRAALGKAIRSSGIEALEEIPDEVIQGVIEKFTTNPELTWNEILGQRAPFAGLAAALTTAPIGASVELASIKKPKAAAPEPTPEPAPTPEELSSLKDQISPEWWIHRSFQSYGPRLQDIERELSDPLTPKERIKALHTEAKQLNTEMAAGEKYLDERGIEIPGMGLGLVERNPLPNEEEKTRWIIELNRLVQTGRPLAAQEGMGRLERAVQRAAAAGEIPVISGLTRQRDTGEMVHDAIRKGQESKAKNAIRKVLEATLASEKTRLSKITQAEHLAIGASVLYTNPRSGRREQGTVSNIVKTDDAVRIAIRDTAGREAMVSPQEAVPIPELDYAPFTGAMEPGIHVRVTMKGSQAHGKLAAVSADKKTATIALPEGRIIRIPTRMIAPFEGQWAAEPAAPPVEATAPAPEAEPEPTPPAQVPAWVEQLGAGGLAVAEPTVPVEPEKKEGETYATKEGEVERGRGIEPPRDVGVVPEEREDRTREAEKHEARTEDRNRGGIKPSGEILPGKEVTRRLREIIDEVKAALELGEAGRIKIAAAVQRLPSVKNTRSAAELLGVPAGLAVIISKNPDIGRLLVDDGRVTLTRWITEVLDESVTPQEQRPHAGKTDAQIKTELKSKRLAGNVRASLLEEQTIRRVNNQYGLPVNQKGLVTVRLTPERIAISWYDNPAYKALSDTEKSKYRGGDLWVVKGQEEAGTWEQIGRSTVTVKLRHLSTGRQKTFSISSVLRKTAKLAPPAVTETLTKEAEKTEKAHDSLLDQPAPEKKTEGGVPPLFSQVLTEVPPAAEPIATHKPSTKPTPTAEPTYELPPIGTTGAFIRGVRFEGEVNPIRRVEAELVAAAIGRLRKIFPHLQIRNVRLFQAKPGESMIVTLPTADGFENLYVDLDALRHLVGPLTVRQANTTMDAILFEELIHNVFGLVLHKRWTDSGADGGTGFNFHEYWRSFHEALFNEMTTPQRNWVASQYGIKHTDPDFAYKVGVEFPRALLQKKLSGKTTEDVLKALINRDNLTFGEKIVDYIKRIGAYINGIIARVPAGSAHDLLQDMLSSANDIIRGVEKFSSDEKGLQWLATPGKPLPKDFLEKMGKATEAYRRWQARRGPGPMSKREMEFFREFGAGAPVYTERQYEQQEKFIGWGLAPEQVRQMRETTWTQTEGAVGHAKAQFESLPDEVQAHAPSVRTRLDILAKEGKILRKPEFSNMTLEELVNALPEEWRSEAIFDAQQNIVELQRDGIAIKQKLQQAKDNLEGALKEPLAGSLDGAKRAYQTIKEEMINEFGKILMQMKRDGEERGDDQGDLWIASANKAQEHIRNLRKTNATSLHRVVEAMVRLQDANKLDKKKLGIGQAEFNFLQKVARALPAARAKQIVQEALGDNQKEVEELQQVVDWFDKSLFGHPTWTENMKYLVREMGMEESVVTISDVDMVFQDPLDPNPYDEKAPHKLYVIRWSNSKGMDDENQRTAYEWVNAVEDALRGGRLNPIRAEAFRHQRDNMLGIYLNPNFRTDAVKLITNEFNLWTAIPEISVSIATTPESRLEGVGGNAANYAYMRLRAASQQLNLVSRIHRMSRDKIERAAFYAYTEHGMSPGQWVDRVSNPILASYQETGGKRYRVGQKVNGVTITKKDWDAIQLQKAFTDQVIKESRDLQTVQNRAFPTKIRDSSKIMPIERYAGHTGPMTMPRHTNPKLFRYLNAWAQVSRHVSVGEQIRGAEEIVTGVRSPGFIDLIMGHIKSAVDQPSYNDWIKPRFESEYRDLARMWDEGDPEAPASFQDVIYYIHEHYNLRVDQEAEMNIDQIKEEILIKEVGRALDRAQSEGLHERELNETTTTVDVTSADNFMVKPRGMSFLPDTLWNYDVSTVDGQYQIVKAANEVHVQHVYDSMRQIVSSLNAFMGNTKTEIEAIMNQEGVKESVAEKRVVQRQKEEQRLGRILWNYSEARYHKRHILRGMDFISQLADAKNKGNLFNDEIRSEFRSFRRLFATGLMGGVLIATRNRLGPIIRTIQIQKQLGKVYSHLGQFMGYDVKIPYAGVQVTWGIGKALLNWITQSGWFVSQKLNKYAPGIMQALEANPDAYGAYAGMVFRFLKQRGNLYDRLVEFGLGGDEHWWYRLKNLVLLREYGGRNRREPVVDQRKILRRLEFWANVAHEVGVLNLTPRSFLSHTADQEANMDGMALADEVRNQMRLHALEAFRTRQELGIPISEDDFRNATTRLTPQELLASKDATDRQAVYTRTLFGKAGINIDLKFMDYWKRYQQAVEAGQDPMSVEFFTGPEWNSFMMLMADEANRSSFFNRPDWMAKSELGRWMMMFFGYPIWMNSKYIAARARLSNTERGGKTFLEGNVNTLKLLWAAIMVGIVGDDIIRAMQAFFYGERRHTQPIAKAVSSLSMGNISRAIMENPGPFLPMQAGMLNLAVNRTLKPGMDIGPSGIQFVPISMINNVAEYILASVSAGEVLRPSLRLLERWAPNWKIPTHLLPFKEGTLNYYNANRAIRSARPAGIEMSSSYKGNVYARGATSDNRDNVINALCKSDNPDWPTVQRERLIGLKALQERGVSNPAAAFDNSIMARMPFRAVLGRLPTAGERKLFFDRLPDEDKRLVEMVERRFLQYAAGMGRDVNLIKEPPSLGKKTSVPSWIGRGSVVPGYGVPSNPFLSAEERERVVRNPFVGR